MAPERSLSPTHREAAERLRQLSADEGTLVLRDARGSPYMVPRAIRIVLAGHAPVDLALYPDQPVTFGRQSGNSVVLSDDAISREHGKLTFRDDGRWVFRDLGSRNGSFLSEFIEPEDGEPVRKLEVGIDHVVAAGQCILFGNKNAWVSLLPQLPEGARAGAQARAASEATRRLESAILDHAAHELPVVLLGPSGSGKTYVARRIHEESKRCGQFVLVSCARLPDDANTLQSELLGHVRGAFTNAVGPRLGRIQSAQDGTLFLDEVESMPRAAQDFLLDLLDGSGTWAPLGADPRTEYPRPRFRLISASKVPLAQSSLRRDLQYRLAHGGSLVLPTLEERREDIPALVQTFVERVEREQNLKVVLAPEAMKLLEDARWPGQVRELEGVVLAVIQIANGRRQRERASHATGAFDASALRGFLESGEEGSPPELLGIGVEAVREQLRQHALVVGEHKLPPVEPAPLDPSAWRRTLAGHPAVSAIGEPGPSVRKRPEDLTADDIRAALESAGGNKTHAARALGIAVNTLKAKMKAFGVD